MPNEIRKTFTAHQTLQQYHTIHLLLHNSNTIVKINIYHKEWQISYIITATVDIIYTVPPTRVNCIAKVRTRTQSTILNITKQLGILAGVK